MIKQAALWLMVLAGSAWSVGAAETYTNWTGVFFRQGSAAEAVPIRVSKQQNVLRFEGFHDRISFSGQNDGSWSVSTLGTIRLRELSGADPHSHAIDFEFWHESGTLLGSIAEEPILCEIGLTTSHHVSVHFLEKGAARLSGGYRPTLIKVDDSVAGAQFVRIPWRSTPAYNVEVTKSGYLYALHLYQKPLRQSKLKWQDMGKLVTGAYLQYPVFRTPVEKGQIIEISGYELIPVAGKIVLR